MVKKDMRQKKNEFSKTLLIQESVLIWITTICFIVLAFYCVIKQYFGELPWLTAMAAFPWSAYGVSQVFYYKKSMLENTKGGIKYDTVMKELDNQLGKYLNMTYGNNADYNDLIKELIKNNNSSSTISSTNNDTKIFTETQISNELNVDYGI